MLVKEMCGYFKYGRKTIEYRQLIDTESEDECYKIYEERLKNGKYSIPTEKFENLVLDYEHYDYGYFNTVNKNDLRDGSHIKFKDIDKFRREELVFSHIDKMYEKNGKTTFDFYYRMSDFDLSSIREQGITLDDIIINNKPNSMKYNIIN